MTGHDDVVLVTGGSSGIGREVAVRLAARGGHVALLARDPDKLDRVASECVAAGARSADVFPCDVGDADTVAAVVRKVTERHGRLDAVVNAAGVFACGPFDRIPVDVFDTVVRTNLLGSANVARAALPQFREQGGGTLVLFGSLLGHITVSYAAPYVASKWGVRALARMLEADVRDAPGVRIGYVAPGGVDTPIYARAANYLGSRLIPPPPVAGPEVVAKDVLDILDGRRLPRMNAPLPRLFHLGARAGRHVIPARAWDAMVSKALPLIGLDRGQKEEPNAGNVLEPVS